MKLLNLKLKNRCLLLVVMKWLLLLLASEVALAKESELEIVTRLSETYAEAVERKVNETLDRSLGKDEFLSVVTSSVNASKVQAWAKSMKTKASKVQLQSLPGEDISADYAIQMLQKLRPKQVKPFLGNLTVVLTFDETISAEKVKILVDTVTKKVGLQKNFGEKIVVRKAKLVFLGLEKKLELLQEEVASQKSTAVGLTRLLQEERQNTTTNLLEIGSLKQSLDTEKDRVSEELKKKESLAQEKSKLEKRIEDLNEELSIYKTPLGDIKKIVRGLELPITMIPLALLLFTLVTLGGLVFLRNQTKRANVYLGAVDQISGALGKIGKQGGSGASKQSALHLKQSMSGGGGSEGKESSEEIEMKRVELKTIWAELIAQPFFTTLFLKVWIQNELKIEFCSSILGHISPSDSKIIYEMLSQNDIEKLTMAEQSSSGVGPAHSAVKKLYLEISSHLRERPDWVSQVDVPGVSSCTVPVMAEILSRLESQEAVAMLFILPDQLASEALAAVPNPQRGTLASLFGDSDLLDEQKSLSLLNKATEAFAGQKSNQDRYLSRLASTMLERLDNQSREALLGGLTKKPEVLDAVKERVITNAQIMSLPVDVLAEIVETFDDAEIADYTIGLSEEEKEGLFSILPRKTVASLEEQIDKIKAKPILMKKASLRGREVQAVIVDNVRKLIEEEVIVHPARAAQNQEGHEERPETGESAA